MLDRSTNGPRSNALQTGRFGDAIDDPNRDFQHRGPYAHGANQPLAEEDERFDPLKLLLYVVKYRWIFAGLFIVGVLAGYATYMMTTPIYRAAARMEIATSGARVVQDLEVVSDRGDPRAFQTAVEKIRSRAVMRRVVYELNLANDPEFLFPKPDFALSNLVNRVFSRESSVSLDDFTAEQREGIAMGRVASGLSADIVRGTSIIQVSYRNPSRDYARRVANQVVDSFIEQRVDQTGQTSDLARNFIQEQVTEVKQKLQEAERDLNDYARANGITITGDEGSLVQQNLGALNASLSEVIGERLNLESLVRQIDEGGADTIGKVLENESIREMRTEIAALKAEYQEKLSSFKPGFPEMRKLQAKINELISQQNQLMQAIAGSIKLDYQQAVEREKDLRAQIKLLEEEQLQYQDKSIQYTILKRDVDSYRSQYDSLIGKLNEVGVGSDLKSQNASVVDYANTPGAPIAPRLSRNLMGALMFAGVISVAIVYLLELLNNTFKVPDQVESELKVPVLGILPHIDPSNINEEVFDHKSAISEAYRSLRTSLQFTAADGAPKTLFITSAEPSEGKTTTSHKLAHDFAALGQKVLLIDADMRRPKLHKYEGLGNTLGLSNILTNTVPGNERSRLFHKIEGGPTMLTAGPIPPNPPDLLSSQRFSLLLHAATKTFDMIIIDGPPVLGLSDAPILSRMTEGTLMVVSTNQVARRSAVLAIKRLRSAGGSIIGAVMSKFRIESFEYNYAYRYMNSHYYSYGSDAPKLENQAGAQNEQSVDNSGFIRSVAARFGNRFGSRAQRS